MPTAQSSRTTCRISASQARASLPHGVAPTQDGNARSRGVLTVDDLRARSTFDAVTMCWHWTAGKTTDGTPRIWTLDYDLSEKKTMSGPKAVWHIAHGEGTRGRLVYRSCVCTDCVNPAHMKLARNRAEIGAHIQRNGARKGSTLARLKNLQRAWEVTGCQPTAPEVVLAIRADTASTLSTLGERYGISAKTVSRIRRGDSHKYLLGAA